MTDQEWESAWKRASGIGDFVGTGKQVPARIQCAIVEVQVLCVRNKDLRGPMYLSHPHHLPEGNDLRFLMAGDVPKDAQLRSDARDWAHINKCEAQRSAQGLKNAISAIRLADELLNDPDNDEVLDEWKREIDAYVRAVFKVDHREAPIEDRPLEAWCVAQCNLTNPCPEWLREYRKGMKVEFESTSKTLKDLKPRNLRVVDDDE